MAKKTNRAQRRKTAVQEAIAAVAQHADLEGYKRGYRLGKDNGEVNGRDALADQIVREFSDIAQGFVELRQEFSSVGKLRVLMQLLRDWVAPYNKALAHARNASQRRGAVIPPHPGFPIPLTVEVASHNVNRDVQVVTATLHRAGGGNATVVMMEAHLPPALPGDWNRAGLARLGALARGDEQAMIPEVFKTVIRQLLDEVAQEYCRVNLQQFDRLLRRRR